MHDKGRDLRGGPSSGQAGGWRGFAKAVGGGYCRLQMPWRLALGVRGTVAGRRPGAPLLIHPYALPATARGGGGGAQGQRQHLCAEGRLCHPPRPETLHPQWLGTCDVDNPFPKDVNRCVPRKFQKDGTSTAPSCYPPPLRAFSSSPLKLSPVADRNPQKQCAMGPPPEE